MCSVIKEIFPFPFVFSFLIMRTHAAKKCNVEIWKKRFSWVTSHELHLDWIKHENWSLLKLIRSNIIKGSLSRQQFLSLFSWSPRKNVNSRQFFGVCVTPGCVTISTCILCKTSKMKCAFTSLGGLLFNCQSWIFHMLYYNSRTFLRYNDSSKISCTKPWFFPLKFRKIWLFMKVLKIGIFGRFWPSKKCITLAIFLPNSIVTGMPYLPAKDELVSFNRLSSRGLWK